mgnify:CR=1 FL=1
MLERDGVEIGLLLLLARPCKHLVLVLQANGILFGVMARNRYVGNSRSLLRFRCTRRTLIKHFRSWIEVLLMPNFRRLVARIVLRSLVQRIHHHRLILSRVILCIVI